MKAFKYFLPRLTHSSIFGVPGLPPCFGSVLFIFQDDPIYISRIYVEFYVMYIEHKSFLSIVVAGLGECFVCENMSFIKPFLAPEKAVCYLINCLK